MPNPEEEEEALGRQRRRRQQAVASSLSLLIEAHPLVLQHLVSSPRSPLLIRQWAQARVHPGAAHLVSCRGLTGPLACCVVRAGA